MDLKYLQTFAAIVEEGSFNQSGQKIKLYPVHHHISDGSAGAGTVRPAV